MRPDGKTMMRSTRYLTAFGQEQKPTKRETVAMMHEKVTGLRENTSVFLMGVDRTQSIALDEIFGKKNVDQSGRTRTTKVFRKTRITQKASEGQRTTK